SVGTTDIEYLFPFSDEPQELEGVAHRGAFDLTAHMEHSRKDLKYFDEEAWAKMDKSAFKGDRKREQEEKDRHRFVPHVIEPSAAAIAARTRPGRRGASPSTARRSRTTPSPSATATPRSSAACRSGPSPTNCGRRCGRSGKLTPLLNRRGSGAGRPCGRFAAV